MSNDNAEKKQPARTTPPTVDGFDGFTDEVEGTKFEGHAGPGAIIQGTKLAFSNEGTWNMRDGEQVPAEDEFITIDIARVVQKWKDQQPVETRVLGPNEKVPDIEALNETTPRSEWGKDFNGNPRGPWQFQYVTYLLDPATLDRYSYPTATVGGGIAVRDIAEKTKWMRKFRGERVCAVVALSNVFMNTRFGGRQRPHFIVKRWITLGGGGGKAIDGDGKPLLPPATGAVTPEPATDAILPGMMQTVAEPSLAEQVGDEVSWNDGSVLRSHLKKSVEPQEPPINKRGVQKIAGGRGR